MPLLAILHLILAVAFAAAPALTSPFSGFESDQLPIPQVDPPVQPAGYAFSIWGLIYAWLVVSGGYGLWMRRGDPYWDAARRPLLVSLAIGVPWLAIANASAIWATIAIFLMAGFAIWALMRAPSTDRLWFAAPTGLYAGWLTAASFVSLGSTMAGYGIGPGQIGWAWIGIIGAALVAWTVQTRTLRVPEYGAAVAWAAVGIYMANGPYEAVGLAAGAVALAVAALLDTRVIPNLDFSRKT